MKFNIKKIVAAACMAAFLATAFTPAATEASNGRMSLAQAQQQIKRPAYPAYKPAHRPDKHHYKGQFNKWANNNHRPAMHTRGPVSRTWEPVRNAPPHRLKSRSHTVNKKKMPMKAHSPVHKAPSLPYKQSESRR